MVCTFSKKMINKVIDFHGHWCPGLAIGIRAAELALKRLGRSKEADWVAIVETDMCGVDAIQMLTGCTFGKGNLIHLDYGKVAFSFFDRKKGKGVRVVLQPELREEISSELQSLMKKINKGTISIQGRKRLEELRQTLQDKYMKADLKDMFSITKITAPIPRPARILQSLRCEVCGEMTMESRTRRFEGKTLCIPCFSKVDQKI